MVIFAATLFSGLSYFGIAVSPPWATAGEIKALKTQLVEMQTAQDIQGRALLMLQREYYAKQLADATDELENNPNSTTAKALKANAEKWIAYIDKQLALLPPS
jgi:hypothetical protein